MNVAHPLTLWQPRRREYEQSNIAHYMSWLSSRTGTRAFEDYHDLWAWSVNNLDEFWGSLGEFFGLIPAGASVTALAQDTMPGAVWFPDLSVNWAEAVLQRLGDGVVV